MLRTLFAISKFNSKSRTLIISFFSLKAEGVLYSPIDFSWKYSNTSSSSSTRTFKTSKTFSQPSALVSCSSLSLLSRKPRSSSLGLKQTGRIILLNTLPSKTLKDLPILCIILILEREGLTKTSVSTSGISTPSLRTFAELRMQISSLFFLKRFIIFVFLFEFVVPAIVWWLITKSIFKYLIIFFKTFTN